MDNLDKYGVPEVKSIVEKAEPNSMYRFVLYFSDDHNISMYVNKVDILYEKYFIKLNVQVRESIGENIFTRLMKYEPEDKIVHINLLDNTGEVCQTIKVKDFQISELGMKLDYTNSSVALINFVIFGSYDDTTE